MKIINKTKNTTICEKADVADTFLSRMIGLINRASIAENEALIITRCNSIHMLFMRFAIDAIFVDREDVVVGMVYNIKPYRFSRMFIKSSYVIELAPGAIEKSATTVGDEIEKGLNESPFLP